MRKIKIAMVAANLELNGISSVIMNYCKNINLDKFEIIIFAGKSINEDYKNECDELGIQVVELPSKKKNIVRYYLSLVKNIKHNYFDIIHVHGNSAVMFLELFIGCLKGIKVRIAHCHNSTCNNIKMHKLLNPLLKKIYTKAFSCGKNAGDWIFGENNYTIINNGININKFILNDIKRQIERKKLNIKSDEFVIGHIGRINNQKNQEFLLRIFEDIADKNEKVKLLMIGDGPNAEKIRNLVLDSRFRNRIILYGESTEPEKFYNVMDIFVFPSRYEGFPVTIIEALASGLNCIVSDKITKEINSCYIQYNSINDSTEMWIKSIMENMNFRRNSVEKNIIKNYEIKQCVKKLEEIYLKELNK